MGIKLNADGSIDMRTKKGKALVMRMAKALAKTTAKPKTKVKVKKTSSGKVDKRTKEGKEICARMAKARKAQNSLSNRLMRLFK